MSDCNTEKLENGLYVIKCGSGMCYSFSKHKYACMPKTKEEEEKEVKRLLERNKQIIKIYN